jgi:hypothetical protein
MHSERIKTLIQAFNVSKRSEIDAAWALADSMDVDLPVLLAEAFHQIRRSEGRASILRYLGKFSRTNEAVFQVGLTATQDRSWGVRHYACAMLAYSLRTAALPALSLLLKHSDRRTVEDAKAAIDAIKNRNHNFFHDRNHTGRVNWGYA